MSNISHRMYANDNSQTNGGLDLQIHYTHQCLLFVEKCLSTIEGIDYLFWPANNVDYFSQQMIRLRLMNEIPELEKSQKNITAFQRKLDTLKKQSNGETLYMYHFLEKDTDIYSIERPPLDEILIELLSVDYKIDQVEKRQARLMGPILYYLLHPSLAKRHIKYHVLDNFNKTIVVAFVAGVFILLSVVHAYLSFT